MQQPETTILEPLLLEATGNKALPQWIKIFSWLFLIFGGISVMILFLSIFGMPVQLSLYGLSTGGSLQFLQIFVLSLFILKGVVAFGLLTRKKWAIQIGIIDGLTGIVICIATMVFSIFGLGNYPPIRLELALLIPYLLKLVKLKKTW